MKPISFYLLTDTHYFETSLGASGAAYDEYMKREQYFMAESSDIVKTVFAKLAEDKSIETVIIPGDLSKNGEIESHKSFVKELYIPFNQIRYHLVCCSVRIVHRHHLMSSRNLAFPFLPASAFPLTTPRFASTHFQDRQTFHSEQMQAQDEFFHC